MANELTTLIAEIRARVDAARTLDTAFAVSEGAPTKSHTMQIAIRTAAYPLVQNAPTDIIRLLAALELAIEQRDDYVKASHNYDCAIYREIDASNAALAAVLRGEHG
jgi:hypothetical protein